MHVARRALQHELLGQGAQKKVYKAFDEEDGMEVAWNVVPMGELAFANDKDRKRCVSMQAHAAGA